ncbi:MAG: hypothetical protein JRI54_14800, partial [Deltaproteobacteria bacterium]|nr:hypothetical protein [Deltaproteobacteria bacterium]
MKGLTFLVLLSVFFTFGSFTGEASWLIDTGQFHASSHGQFSCLDCHSEIQEQKLHPDPANVNRRLEDFFNVERCFNCHDDVLDSLAKGFHGGKEIRRDEEYQYCLRCHDPHYQLSR